MLQETIYLTICLIKSFLLTTVIIYLRAKTEAINYISERKWYSMYVNANKGQLQSY